jgi:hypothetical protein
MPILRREAPRPTWNVRGRAGNIKTGTMRCSEQ